MANTKVSSEQIIDGLALGGNPTAATQTAGNNSTRIATTAYTDAAVTALIGGAPSTLDTLNEIAAAVSDDPDYVGTVNAALALKAPKASPTFTGAVTANGGVVVDNFTLDGTTLALSSGDMTLDVAGDIYLNADGGEIFIADGATNTAVIQQTSSNFILRSLVSDKDIFFRGNDGGSEITALTLDMSNAGAATFASSINTNSDVVIAKSATGVPNLTLSGFAGASTAYSIINFYNEDGSQQGPNNAAQIKALAINTDGSGGSLDFHTSTGTGSNGADATKKVTIGGGGAFTTYPSAGQPTVFNENGVDADFRVEAVNQTHALFVEGSSGLVGIGTSAPQAVGSGYGSLTVGGSSGGGLIFNSTGSGFAGMWASTNGLAIQAFGARHMAFSTNDTERMRLDTDGRLAINNNTTAADADIPDDIKLVVAGGTIVGSAATNNNSFLGYRDVGGLTVLQASGNYGLRIFDDNSTTARFTVARNGTVTMPYQPAFLARATSEQSNIAINSYVTVVLGTEVFDQGSNFASNTFTAPVTGKYQFNWAVELANVPIDSVYIFATLTTSNRAYRTIIDPESYDASPTHLSLNGAALADMDAGDTAYMTLYQGAGTAQVDIATETYLSGYLVA